MQSVFRALNVTTAKNPAGIGLNGEHRWSAFLQQAFNDLFELMNEEFLGIFIFLAFAAALMEQFHFRRNVAIWGSLAVSIIVFGMVHFAAYQWNLIQMLVLIGVTRLFLTGAYLYSKSIWTSFAMHYTFDTMFFLILAGATWFRRL